LSSVDILSHHSATTYLCTDIILNSAYTAITSTAKLKTTAAVAFRACYKCGYLLTEYVDKITAHNYYQWFFGSRPAPPDRWTQTDRQTDRRRHADYRRSVL